MTRTQAAAPSQDDKRLTDGEFKTLLAGVIPHLRAYGRSLSGNPDLADDLTQDTMVKAWASRDRFERGTSIKAWTFVILRNTFLSQMRRNKFRGDYDELAVERTLSTPASQEEASEMADLQRALMELPQDQREALILVGAGGLSYEEAASICDCALGTMKSRVSRARGALEEIMTRGQFSQKRADAPPASEAMDAIMDSVEIIAARREESRR
ncbi:MULTISPECIES: sigma-70 family RNA polymerase sigma factor [Sphingopyxis]|jgi:RNA polymerase sigma-70 factor (ECF subfamily)|uniref:sigma-70 family RNA polymerase sigma factor n=1 Tax=Sphingopyxis TaxID=165697 RepID=UPI000836E4CB|nr:MULTISPECIES: sigma-70 family RNA polymerase sigma factor [Sphingopyxis]APW72078.1 RNA polymerase subunit sigma-70 [Sphingopyxis granuli]AVA12830.1 RNA polymerase subunit sigma-70 [Sphingopyxis sp. MG]ODU29446.1 MAG: RNA polymerase subunit sigma-70 [Sphingopyxis sp. SCN 67-31]QUM72136.1 sigma-70 family RNA polymerase sigma factor [Sphingopyxis granuli]UNK80622.1 sigma-70 family RNA polymerase sigma factor [Sphingopyxis granuli]